MPSWLSREPSLSTTYPLCGVVLSAEGAEECGAQESLAADDPEACGSQRSLAPRRSLLEPRGASALTRMGLAQGLLKCSQGSLITGGRAAGASGSGGSGKVDSSPSTCKGRRQRGQRTIPVVLIVAIQVLQTSCLHIIRTMVRDSSQQTGHIESSVTVGPSDTRLFTALSKFHSAESSA